MDKKVWPSKEEMEKEIVCLQKARVQKVVPLVTLMFVLCYFGVALFYFNFP